MSQGRVRLDVECDGCRKVESIPANSAELACQQLEEMGWLRNGSRDQDLCPECFYGRTGYGVSRQLL